MVIWWTGKGEDAVLLQTEIDDKKLKGFSEVAKEKLAACVADYAKSVTEKANKIAKIGVTGKDVEVTGEMVVSAASGERAFRRRRWLTSVNAVKVLNGIFGLLAGGLFDWNDFGNDKLRLILFLVCFGAFLVTLILQCIVDD